MTRKKISIFAAFGAISVALLSGVVSAADVPLFPKGQLTLQAYAGYAYGMGDRHEDIPSANMGVNYYLADNFSLGLEVAGLYVVQPGDDASAIGLSAVMRHHLIAGRATSLFADVLFGPVEASSDVPAGGTRFSFITRAGLGVTHRLDERIDLLGGVRYFHLSNAQIEGDDRNPSINGVEIYIGILWRL